MKWLPGMLGALLVPAVLVGQQVPARLTLVDALEIARRGNPEYQQAVNSALAQGAQIRAGWGAFLPTLSARLAFSGTSSRTVTGQDDFGRPVELPNPVTFRRSAASQSVSAGLTVFDGFRNLNSLRATRASADAAYAAREAVGTRIDAETARRFYEALRTTRLIALEERLLASAREQLDNTRRLFRIAGATREDVLGAEADVATQELQFESAKGDARKAVLAVREHLGIVEDIDFSVAGDLPDTWDPATLDVEALVSRATESTPRVLQLEASARAADLRVSAQRAGRWPTIMVNASLSRSVSLSSYDALFQFNPRNRGFGIGITLDLPVFTGFQTAAQIATASLESRNAHETVRASRLQVEREVRAAVIDVRNTYRGRQLAERAAELSLERLQLARQRYAIGAMTFANLQLLIDRAAQEERRLVNAQFQLAQAVVTLDERVGRSVQP